MIQLCYYLQADIPKTWDDKVATYYELYATVAYVRDTKTGGNLVSHVHVGEEYHRRKEGVTCTQWYLFNDFSITPVERVSALFCVVFLILPFCEKILLILISIVVNSDFLLQQEAVYFNLEWKIPCVLYFCRSDVVKKHPIPGM